MSRILPASAIAAALAVGAASIAAGASATPRLLSCSGKPLLRPHGTVVLSCADAGSELRSTTWQSWGPSSARGTTDFGLNLCTPNCAASSMSFFPASTVRLSAPVHSAKGRLFSRATISYRLHGVRRTFVAYPPTR
jgi:hypothetical protein